MEKDFIKGFNQGYILRKYNQKQYEGLSNGITTESEYFDGLREGAHEAALEINKDRLNELENLRSRGDDFEIER